MSGEASLYAHLETGATTVCRAWAIRRPDGLELGFTDHDRDLVFDGLVFRAGTGLSARSLSQTTGLSVDNTEAEGALSDAAVTEADLIAGRYDGADLRVWQVNWADPAARALLFRGTLGEIVRAGGAFRAEMRGLTEALNRPLGRAYQRGCSAVLGDAACRFDLDRPGYAVEIAAEGVEGARVFRFAALPGIEDRWFEGGRLRVLTGAAAGAVALVKNDRTQAGGGRQVELWQAVDLRLASGDLLRIEAGCDKRAETCRLKFGNFLNFRGFPHIPGEDWLSAYPSAEGRNDGGSLAR